MLEGYNFIDIEEHFGYKFPDPLSIIEKLH